MIFWNWIIHKWGIAKNHTADARWVELIPWYSADSWLLRGRSGWGTDDSEGLACVAAVALGCYRVNDKYKDCAWRFDSHKKIKTVNPKQFVKWRRPQDLHVKVVEHQMRWMWDWVHRKIVGPDIWIDILDILTVLPPDFPIHSGLVEAAPSASL